MAPKKQLAAMSGVSGVAAAAAAMAKRSWRKGGGYQITKKIAWQRRASTWHGQSGNDVAGGGVIK